MTWKAFHNRGETLRSVIATAAVRRDGVLPLDVDGVAETFRDELDLLGALQLKWHTRLAGHIERAMVSQPLDLPGAVATAWARAATELAGVRDIIDHYRQHPVDADMAAAVAKATAKEHQFLAVMAGLAGLGDTEAQAVGAQIEARARALHDAADEPAGEREPRRTTLLDRLRAVMAA